jgi:AcrR family transcriptional regulator
VRTRLAPDDRRERVLAAATTLFENEPYDQLTTQRLAEGCGVSEGLVYHYFGTKRGLYVACVERKLSELVRSIRDPGADLPIEERLRGAIDSYLDFVERFPRGYTAVLGGGIGTDAEVEGLVEDARARFCRLIVRGLGVEQPSPRFDLAVYGWMGFVEAACTRWLRTPGIERDDVAELLTETALATFGRALAA